MSGLASSVRKATDAVLGYVVEHEPLRHQVTSVLRAYIRYSPVPTGKELIWSRIIGPYLAWLPHEFVASTISGSRIAGNTRELLQQYLYYFGVWEPQLTRWMASTLRPGDTFVDVGANIGHFSLLASKLVGHTGRVVAIEASPRTFRALEENIVRNGVQNARAVNMAVAEVLGTVTMFQGPEWHVGLATALPEMADQRYCESGDEVLAGPLPDILDAAEFKATRLVKIDVEGMEWSVVAGMKPMLESGRRDLEVTVEADPACLATEGRTPEDLIALFSDFGFHAYRLENDYSPPAYLRPSEGWRPVRLTERVRSTTDLVFSRTNAATL